MEEKPKQSTRLVVALIVGIVLITSGILGCSSTEQDTPPERDTPRYSEETVIDMAMNYVSSIERGGGGYHPTDGYATYLGNGVWKVRVQTSVRGIVTVYVDEKTGRIY